MLLLAVIFSKKVKKGSDISFHGFPVNKERRKSVGKTTFKGPMVVFTSVPMHFIHLSE